MNHKTNFPWLYDLQLNLEIWKQVAKEEELDSVLLSRKPLKFNVEYLEKFIEKAKLHLKRRSQHELLLQPQPSS